MKIDDFLARLDGVTKQSNGWLCCCPAHGDSNPSLSVDEGEDGRILVKCHAGCETSAVVDAMGLKMSDLMPERPGEKNGASAAPGAQAKVWGAPGGAKRKASAKQEPFVKTAEYEYQDEDGATLYWVCRGTKGDNKKSFQQRRPKADGAPGFEFGLHSKPTKKGEERKLLVKYCAPFRLPRVVKAASEGKSIAILEGEKDVLTFERVTGCVGTCNSGGAGKWANDWPEDWIKWFQGCKSILIIADNDPETKTVVRRVKGKDVVEDKPHWRGQKHAWDVKKKLEAAGYKGTIRLMVMPGVPEQTAKRIKDFTDWVEARKMVDHGVEPTKADFAEAVKAAEPWPEKWQFDDAAMAGAFEADPVAPKKRRDRQTTSDDGAPVGDTESAQKESADSQTEWNMARFGYVVAPRTPDDVSRYEANIHLGKAGVYTVAIGKKDDLQMAIAIQCAKVSAKLSGVGVKMDAARANNLKALVCLLWLRARGKFFWREPEKRHDTSMYFDELTGILRNIGSDEFRSELASASGINRESVTFKYMMAFLEDASFSPDVAQGVKPSNLWECVDGQKIYISSGDSEMYRITASGIDKVQNCTDGVVFLRGKTLKPWVLKDGDGIDPFAESTIFKGASFADDFGRMIVRLWYMNLFRNHKKKPPLLITGEYQSGKTKMAESIEEILGVNEIDKRALKKGDKGEEAFWMAMENQKITIFDNVDSRIDWIKDAMQIAATGGIDPNRKLYTDNEESVRHPNAHVIITSNNPMFTSDLGLSDRMQTANLNTTRKTAAEDALSRDIVEHRDDFLTWTARLLSKALADTQPVADNINKRHPEYSSFGIRIGRAGGFETEARAAMGFAEINKALLPLKNDETNIAQEILAVLLEKRGEWKFFSNELADAIVKRKEDAGESDEKTKEYFNTRRVGKCLNKFLRPLSVVFKANPPSLYQGKTRYWFTGMTEDIGQLVGKVGINGACDKAPTKEEELELSIPPAFNPPNQPNNEEGYDDADFDFD